MEGQLSIRRISTGVSGMSCWHVAILQDDAIISVEMEALVQAGQ